MGTGPAPAARRFAQVFASLRAAALRDSLERAMLVVGLSMVSGEQPLITEVQQTVWVMKYVTEL